MCVHLCMCAVSIEFPFCGSMLLCVHKGSRRGCVFLDHLPLHCLRQGLSLNWKSTLRTTLVGQHASRMCLSSPLTLMLGLQVCAARLHFYAGDLNLGKHSYPLNHLSNPCHEHFRWRNWFSRPQKVIGYSCDNLSTNVSFYENPCSYPSSLLGDGYIQFLSTGLGQYSECVSLAGK